MTTISDAARSEFEQEMPLRQLDVSVPAIYGPSADDKGGFDFS